MFVLAAALCSIHQAHWCPAEAKEVFERVYQQQPGVCPHSVCYFRTCVCVVYSVGLVVCLVTLIVQHNQSHHRLG